MNNLIVKLLLAIAAATLAACSTYQSVVPDWMPGSGAIKVDLSGQQEVPPLSVPGSGSGSSFTSSGSDSVTPTGVSG